MLNIEGTINTRIQPLRIILKISIASRHIILKNLIPMNQFLISNKHKIFRILIIIRCLLIVYAEHFFDISLYLFLT